MGWFASCARTERQDLEWQDPKRQEEEIQTISALVDFVEANSDRKPQVLRRAWKRLGAC